MDGSQPIALVVDDDASLRLLSRVNLELEGFAVRESHSVASAREAVAEARPAVVLLDVHLGNEASDALLGELRATGVPVCLVTGSADAAAYRDRADAVLSKPFDPEELVSIAKRLAKVSAA
jgi:DNA-binding NtrC family response regulator